LKIPATICFLFILHTAVAQDNQLLFHYSRYKEVIYSVGDVISFRLKGSTEKKSWQITEITDSTIVFASESIAPHKIGYVYVDKKSKIWFPFRFKYANIFLAAGAGYFLIDWANSGEIDSSTVIISGSLVAAGVISKIFIKDYLKLKGSRKLVILR